MRCIYIIAYNNCVDLLGIVEENLAAAMHVLRPNTLRRSALVLILALAFGLAQLLSG